MSVAERRPNPLVFLSSTVRGLRDERRQLFEFGQTFGLNAVWVDEAYREQLPDRKRDGGHERWAAPDINPFDDIDDYLRELNRSKLLVVLVGTERAGSSITPLVGESALATFFEMELAYAAALGRPIALVWLDGVKPEPKLAYLLELLDRNVAVHRFRAASRGEAVDRICSLVEDAASGRYDGVRTSPHQYGSFLEDRWRLRRKGLFWLSRNWPSFADHPQPNGAVIRECLQAAERSSSEGRRLASIWIAMRELMCAPYWKYESRDWLDAWNSVLRVWNSSGAWYGLHGHLELGYMAALNSLAEVAKLGAQADKRRANDPNWDIPYGAQASAYYALARRVNSRVARCRGLLRALALINRAKYQDPIGESNGLAIKGSILLELRNPLGILTYKRVLRIREAAAAPPGAIGEAMTELGYGYVRMGLRRRGTDLLERGVELMKGAGYRSGFIVRAQYKLADAYERVGMQSRAKEVRSVALALAQDTSVGTAARDYSNPEWSGKR